MTEIKSIHALEVLDSRGNPTVEVEMKTSNGVVSAMVPSGASTGRYEAVELRDNEKRYHGKGVRKAVANVNDIIAPKIIGMDCTKQQEIDKTMLELDGTPNKAKLGANAILAVSVASCKSAASCMNTALYGYIANISGRKGVTLPVPMMNIINGGKHAGMENDPQEHMIMPVGAKSFSEGLEMCAEVYHELKSILKKRFGAQGSLLGDEGGFAPKISSVSERLEIIMNAVEQMGYTKDIRISLDPAASEFYKDGKYHIGQKTYSSAELVDFWKQLSETFDIISIEDGMAEDDWEGWQQLTEKLGGNIQLVGDDLLVTNPGRIQTAMDKRACNALLLKVNQIGTISEAIEAANMSFKNDWKVVVSHRSGETEDSFIADLVVGLDSGQSKFGAPARSDRNTKYNRLLRIEDELGEKGHFG